MVLHAESYWSTENAPVIYGATKITIKQGMIDAFDVRDARFRVFAKDFEDGDITAKITYSENVDVNHVGTYNIEYRVTDNHGNETVLNVPVIITDQAEAKINVERTLYTIPSVWNMDLAGFSRCNYGDRQILGVYMPAGTNMRARVLSASNDITVQFLANDSYVESAQTIPTSGEWVTLQNVKNDTDYDSVPLITSAVMKRDTELNKVYKIELEYDETVKELNYYHYQDDENAFRAQWEQDANSYSVIENEVMTIIVPFADRDMMTNHFSEGFQTLDQHLEYYQKVIEKMDEYVGLELNPENLTDQNVRTKYLIKANAHGVGLAYYIGHHVGVNSASVAAFFQMNWGGLHELAHGYQGTLGKGAMGLGEVSNNILGYYIQTDKTLYFHEGNWLGELSAVEETRNKTRLENGSYAATNERDRLYMIVNLLNHFEGGTSYGKIFQWYREALNEGRTMTNQDAYVEALADLYNVNIIPYIEAWGLSVSDDVKTEVYSQNYPLVNILKDMTTDSGLQQIMAGEGIKEKYSLIDNETLQKYGLTGNMTLQLEIDDIEVLKGKPIQIMQNGVSVRTITIDSASIVVHDLPIGTYDLKMPIHSDYMNHYAYIQIKEGDNNYTYTYTKLQDQSYDNYLSLKLIGIFDTYGYELTFKDNYKKAHIKLGSANMGSNQPYVKIYDDAGTPISEEIVVSNHFVSKEAYEIAIAPGYVIEVNHPNAVNKVKMYSTLLGKEMEIYRPTSSGITKYIVTENGIRKEAMTENQEQEISYDILKQKLVGIIEAYKASVTEEELNDKYINFPKKSEVLNADYN